MSTSLTTGKRSSGAQAQKKCESTFVNKAEGCFCSSQAIIRRVPNSSAPRGAEAEQPRLHQPKPLQAEPHTCKPPKTSASLPGSSPQFPQAHPHRVQNLKISHFALSLQLLFPAPASSELGLPHLTLTQNLSPVLLKPTAQRRRTHMKVGTCSPVTMTPLPASAWQVLSGKRNCRNPQVHLRPSHPKQIPVQHLPGHHRSSPLYM